MVLATVQLEKSKIRSETEILTFLSHPFPPRNCPKAQTSFSPAGSQAWISQDKNDLCPVPELGISAAEGLLLLVTDKPSAAAHQESPRLGAEDRKGPRISYVGIAEGGWDDRNCPDMQDALPLCPGQGSSWSCMNTRGVIECPRGDTASLRMGH